MAPGLSVKQFPLFLWGQSKCNFFKSCGKNLQIQNEQMQRFFYLPNEVTGASLGAQTVKNLHAIKPESNPWVGKIPWRREWLPAPVFLPGEFYGQRNLVGYSPWGHKELDMTE